MKKIFLAACSLVLMAACVNDDQYTWEEHFADKTATDTIRIAIRFDGQQVGVTGDQYGYVSVSGTDVTVKSSTNRFLQLELSGESSDGSLLIYSWKKLGLLLNGLSLTNADGPAINNQCGKSLYVETVSGTENTLADGTAYADAPTNAKGEAIDQKATLFSEGQVYLCGEGTLVVNGYAKNGIASDDYLVMEGGVVEVNMAETASNGIKVNDGLTVNGGTLTIDVKAEGARGVKCDSYTTISGGTTTITTSGHCLIETLDGVSDTTSCAGIKSDSLFTMTGGTLTITSSGDGGKGINCAQDIVMKGGTMTVETIGDNEVGKPKAVKSDTGIILSGGSFTATTLKSWACDNGTETDDPAQRVTIEGTPAVEPILEKQNVVVVF